jgi:hypothetical protein
LRNSRSWLAMVPPAPSPALRAPSPRGAMVPPAPSPALRAPSPRGGDGAARPLTRPSGTLSPGQRFFGASFLVFSDGHFLPAHTADRRSAKLILAVANSICESTMIIKNIDNTEKLGSCRILFRTGVNLQKTKPP